MLAVPGTVAAQGKKADYERAAQLPAMTRGKVRNLTVRPQWLSGMRRFWYARELPEGGREFVLVDAEAGTRRPAFDHERLAAALGKALGRTLTPTRLPLEALAFPDAKTLRFRVEGQAWRCNLSTYAVEKVAADAGGAESGASLRAYAPGERPARVAAEGEETNVTFVNRTREEVRLFWLEGGSERRAYGAIPPGGSRSQHTFAGHTWLVTRADGSPFAVFVAEAGESRAEIGPEPPRPDPAAAAAARREPGLSPDGKWVAFFRNRNLFLREKATGAESALTTDGAESGFYRGPIAWSPDSRRLVVLHTTPGQEHKIYIVESSPADQVQPKLMERDYLKPGDKIPVHRPRLFDVAGKRQIPLDYGLAPNPWMATPDIHWRPDSKAFSYLYNQRGHQVLRVLSVDAETGKTSALVNEEADTLIDYANRFYLEYLDDSGELLWMSDRDGWNHLYLYDANTGRLKNQVTKGEWVVRGVERVDAKARQIYFWAGGVVPEQDPYYRHLCRVNFDGTGFVDLTPGDGTHTVQFSPDGQYLIDTYSRVDLPPVTELRRMRDGALVCPLEKADASALLATGWRWPERFAAKGRDGKTDIYGVIFRPTNFDPAKRYPVVENVYAGPHGSFVPKAFSALHGSQRMAELGFIVVQIDGMGTANRSRAFNTFSWKNLVDGGFPDRIAWMKAAAATRPEMDLTRVGVYGGSAGGQNALAALEHHGDFYKVAVADCGCHDNRMDKIWWNELYMGWPVGPHYEAQSNVTNAHKITGKLLLIVGEKDTNVDPATTMQVVNALVKADKDFELLVLPGAGHGAAETPYGSRRRADFLVRHLLGVEPRAQ
jgi:Dipeptidyl aminopeptidases/acylaminoacyl-peptidases